MALFRRLLENTTFRLLENIPSKRDLELPGLVLVFVYPDPFQAGTLVSGNDSPDPFQATGLVKSPDPFQTRVLVTSNTSPDPFQATGSLKGS